MRRSDKTTDKSKKSRCELTSSPSARAAANKRVEGIMDGFPPGLAQPALRALAAAGFERLEDLEHVPPEELAKLHGMGPKALETIRAALKAEGNK